MAGEFAVNDYVIYGKSGLCIIKEIKKIAMAGTKAEYYILNSVKGNDITIYVPCDNEKLTAKLRRPMTKAEIDNILEEAKGQQLNWIDNNAQRMDVFKQIADGENYRDWLLLASCIHLKKQEKHACGKHLSTSDENILRLVEKLIEDEFCHSLGLSENEVSQYIINKLNIE